MPCEMFGGGIYMNASDFKKYYEHGMDFYYGTRKIIIVEYYENFSFVDVIEHTQRDTIFSLPISVLTLEEKKTDSIYINRIYDMSRF